MAPPCGFRLQPEVNGTFRLKAEATTDWSLWLPALAGRDCMRANRREELLSEVVGLACADALHGQQRIDRLGPQTGHFPQRHVVEDDIRRHAARAGDLQA